MNKKEREGPGVFMRYNCIGCKFLTSEKVDMGDRKVYKYECLKMNRTIDWDENLLEIYLETPRDCPFFEHNRDEFIETIRTNIV